ncbi:hypothetical protein H5T88_00270 [bacterium]|nr:hypothetical protein [bacterium]
MRRFFVFLLPLLTILAFTRELELTVYNQNFGLVKDVRVMELKKGESIVKVSDIPALIDPATVHFKSLTAPEAVVIKEQNYEYDLINPQKLLSKYIGKQIRVRQFHDGKEKLIEGTLLSTTGGTVIQTKDGIVLNPSGQVELPSLPEGLISKPELVWDIICEKEGKHTVELSYITEGLSWRADYVAVINQTDDRADFNGWVTVTNTSGTTYENAKLKLIAGDVRRITPSPLYREEAPKMAGLSARGIGFTEKPLFEYHLYTLRYPTTLKENETKQISFIEAPQIKVKKIFLFEMPSYQAFWWISPSPEYASREKIQVKIEIENTKDNNLGIPLPKGIVRVYKADQDGSLQFVGEDQIDHTPKDEKFRLYLGDAFDLKGERKRVDYIQIADGVFEYEMEISLRNHKEEDVEIIDVEKLTGDWQILKSSHPYEKKDFQTIEFKVKVPANGEVKINYRARVKQK